MLKGIRGEPLDVLFMLCCWFSSLFVYVHVQVNLFVFSDLLPGERLFGLVFDHLGRGCDTWIKLLE